MDDKKPTGSQAPKNGAVGNHARPNYADEGRVRKLVKDLIRLHGRTLDLLKDR